LASEIKKKKRGGTNEPSGCKEGGGKKKYPEKREKKGPRIPGPQKARGKKKTSAGQTIGKRAGENT